MDGIIFYNFVILLIVELGNALTVRGTPILAECVDSHCHFDRQERIQRLYARPALVRSWGSTFILQLGRVLHC